VNDLAKFLLDRIGEDQQAARRFKPLTGDESLYEAWFSLSRVLDECLAKSEVIGVALSECLSSGRHTDESAVLRWLAFPYRNHPDFREEWRP
jgi:hypothetical protein